jgi:hypothetical protein
MGGLKWGAVLGLLLSAAVLRADLAGAQAGYKKGLELMKAKQYQAAITAFEASLAAEPRYVYSWKYIGTCRYYLGDKPGAVEAYDKYLAVIKNDPQTQAFADKLRGQLPEADAVPAERPARRELSLPRWRIGAALGADTVSFKAYNDDWKESSASAGATGTPPSVNDALTLGVVVAYRIIPRLELGLDLDYYLVSDNYSITDLFSGAVGTGKDTFDALWIGPRIGFDFLSTRRFSLGAELGLGYLTLSGAGSDYSVVSASGVTTYTSSASYSGSTVGFKGGLEAVLRLGSHFAFSGDLGYRAATIATVTESWKAISGGSSASGTRTLQRFGVTSSGNLPLDYSGLDLKLGVNFCF